MFFINPTKKPTRPQLISGSIWPREKKDDQQKKTFFGEKEKKLEVIPKKREEGKKTISGFCSKSRKKFGTYKMVEIVFLQIG